MNPKKNPNFFIFTGNTWKYHQVVMFLQKAYYFQFFKKLILIHSFIQSVMVSFSATFNIRISSGLV